MAASIHSVPPLRIAANEKSGNKSSPFVKYLYMTADVTTMGNMKRRFALQRTSTVLYKFQRSFFL